MNMEATMLQRLNVLLLLCAFVFGISAIVQADAFEYTWKAPDAQPVVLSGKKVAVLVLARSRAAGLAAEETLANSITLRGAQGISGHQIVSASDLEDKQKTTDLFQKAGVAAVVVIQGEPEGKETLDPNVWKDKSFWEAYGGRMNFDDNTSHPQDDVKIFVQTKIYSLEQNKLIWVGTSETKVSKIDKFIGTILDSVAEQMVKQGLLHKK